MPSIDQTVEIGGREIPFKIFVERRRSVRVSFGKSAINLRMPASLSNKAKEDHFKKAVEWVRTKARKNPDILLPYELEDYDQKKYLFIYGQQLGLKIKYEDRKTGRGDYDPPTRTINLIIPSSLDGRDKNKMIKQLLSRTCAQIFLPSITKRVHEINDTYFHKKYSFSQLKVQHLKLGKLLIRKKH